jgi:hypothetical protein
VNWLIKLSQHFVEILKKPLTTSATVAVSGRISNRRPPYDDRALTVTDVQHKLIIRKIRRRRRTRGTECKRKEREEVGS